MVLPASIPGFVFCLAFFIALALPGHGAHVENGWTFTNQFPNPMAWASGIANLVPVLHQIYRFRRARSHLADTA